MNKRLYGMAPGGRMALDRAANRRRNIWQVQRQARAREKRDTKNPETECNPGNMNHGAV